MAHRIYRMTENAWNEGMIWDDAINDGELETVAEFETIEDNTMTLRDEYEQFKCTELKTITLKNDWRRRINTVLRCEHINMADIVGVSVEYCPILNETSIIIKVL